MLWGLEDLQIACGLAFVVPLLIVPFAAYGLGHAVFQLQQTQRALFRLAHTDDLTGLSNRRAFLVQGNHILASGWMNKEPTALILLDVNNFKQINDTLGHVAGDGALRYIAETLRGYTQPDDFIARLGGDEFVVLCQRATRQAVENLIEQIRHHLAHFPYHYDGAATPLSVSIGSSDTTEARTLEELLKISDMALYARKTQHHQQTANETKGKEEQEK